MSTQAPHEKYAPRVADGGPTVELISRFKSYRVILEHNEDVYTPQGGLRSTARGRMVKFNGGRASCPEAWMDEIIEHPAFGIDFWVKGDPGGVRARGGPQVVDGGVTTLTHFGSAPVEPPLPEWDDLGAREIRNLVKAGRVDLEHALLWEFNNRNRQQVIEAVRKAKNDSPDAEETDDQSDAGEDAGFVQPTPED